MKRWTNTLPALVLIGAFAVLICPRSRAPGEVVLPAEPDVLVESFPETVTLRLVAKRLIAREAAAGWRSLVEAAALFDVLNRLPPETTRLVRPDNPTHPLPHLPGRTDAEVLCLQVIAHAGVEQPGEPADQARAAAARLEAVYLAELRERGAIQLPDAAGLMPAAELLEWARAAMTDLERRSLANTRGVARGR
jgi:hypothetical protein